MCQDSRSIGALVRRRCYDCSSGPGVALPRALRCQHLQLAGAQPGRSRRFCTEHDEDPLRRRQSAPLVSSRSPLRPLGWARKGGLLLHLGSLVPGCCTSGACTESVTAGADGCAVSKRSGGESEDALEKSNCPSRAINSPYEFSIIGFNETHLLSTSERPSHAIENRCLLIMKIGAS